MVAPTTASRRTLGLFIFVLFLLLTGTLLSFVLRGSPQQYEYVGPERKDPREISRTDCRVAGEYDRLDETKPVPAEGVELCNQEHFKYGSIGSDTLRQGFPYWIWKVLPIMFAGDLPKNGKQGYETFGLIVERDQDNNPIEDRPVGFSKRRVAGLDVVGLNCAFCHASAVRRTASQTPLTIAGMPGHTVDVESFFLFLFKTAKSPEFTADNLFEEIDKFEHSESMGMFQRTVYRWLIIPLYRWEIAKLERKFCFITTADPQECVSDQFKTEAGPGRLDLWALYKVLQYTRWNRLFDLLPDFTPRFLDSADLSVGSSPGFADIAPLWHLERRMGTGFHWDGNTRLVSDYTTIAALGMAITPGGFDHPGFDRVVRWARTHKPPRYEDLAPDHFKDLRSKLLEDGRRLFETYCFACHDPAGRRFGMVEPIELIGTDRNRLDTFTEELARKLKKVGRDFESGVRSAEKTYGYSNVPLDGIWLRAPYLHNGSVPTLRDLLRPPAERPTVFCRGNDLYNWADVGFASVPAQQGNPAPCGTFFFYNTKLSGNTNGGHVFGTDLEDDIKAAILEYLKTL